MKGLLKKIVCCTVVISMLMMNLGVNGIKNAYATETYLYRGVNYYYVENEEGVTISGGFSLKDDDGNDKTKDFYIPSEIDGKPVTEIESRAFYGFYNPFRKIESVYIPNSVKKIGHEAFCHVGLKNISLNDGIVEIDTEAFFWNDDLKEIQIPSSVTNIGYRAFSLCKNLDYIHVDEDNKNYNSGLESNCIIDSKNNTLIAGSNNSVIPESIKTINEYAFYGLDGLDNIEIPDNVETIGENAFYKCEKLENITLPYSVKYVGSEAFRECVNLKNVDILAPITCIYDSTFRNCTNLVNIIFPNTLESIGDYAFCNCKSLSRIDFPDCLNSINQCTFEGSGIESLKISKNVSHIYGTAFKNCYNLREIVVDDNNKTYDDRDSNVLVKKTDPTIILLGAIDSSIPNDITEIGWCAFCGRGVRSVCLPKTTKKIGLDAFMNCKDLSELVVKSDEISIGQYSLSGLTSLKELILPNVISYTTELSPYTNYSFFKGSSNLTVITDNEQCRKYAVKDGVKAMTLEEYYLDIDEVIYSYKNYQVDVLKTPIRIEKDLGNFNIKVNVANKEFLGDGDCYELISSKSKSLDGVVVSNSEGIFTNISPEDIGDGGELSVKVYGKNISITKKIYLCYKTTTTEEEVEKHGYIKSIDLSNDEYIDTLPNKYPFFGGKGVGFNLPSNIPISYSIENGKVCVGLNVDASDMGDIDIEYIFEGAEKEHSMEYTEIVDNIFELTISKYAVDIPMVGNSPGVELAGYGEFELTDDQKPKNFNLYMILRIGITGSYTQDIILPFVIPVDLTLDATGSIEAEATAGFYLDMITGEISADLKMAIEWALDVYAGVGAGKLASVGLYGEVKVGMDSYILPKSYLNSCYIEGELGVQGWLAGLTKKVKVVDLDDLGGEYINDGKLMIYNRDNNIKSLFGPKNVVDIEDKSFESIMSCSEEYNEAKLTKSRYLSANTSTISSNSLAETNVLVNDSYGDAKPNIIKCGDKTMLFYIASEINDQNSLNKVNQTQLKFATYNENTETFENDSLVSVCENEKEVTGDGTADYEYSTFVTDEGEIYVAYMNSRVSFGIDDYGNEIEPEESEYIGSFGISITKYNSEKNRFESFNNIDINNCYCSKPVLNLTNDGLECLWVENKNNIFETGSTYSIYKSVLTNNQWSKPILIKDELKTVISLNAGKIGDTDTISYVEYDSSKYDVNKQSLYMITPNDTVKVFEGNISNLTYTNINSCKVLSWNNDGGIDYINSITGDVNNFIPKKTMDINSSFKICDEKVYYLKTIDGNRNIQMTTKMDGKNNTIILTNESEYIDYFSFKDNMLTYLVSSYQKVDNSSLNSNDNTGFEIKSKIKFFEELDFYDIELSEVYYKTETIEKGVEFPLTINLKNNGNTTINDYRIIISDDTGNIVYNNTFYNEITPGESNLQIINDFVIENDFSGMVYTVEVTNDSYEDRNLEDNRKDIDLSKTELSTELNYIINSDGKYLEVDVENYSYVSANANTVVIDVNGKELINETTNIEPKSNVVYKYKLDDSQIPLDNKVTGFYAKTVANRDEYYNYNNDDDAGVWNVEYKNTVLTNLKSVASVELNEEAFELKIGYSHQLIASVNPTTAENQSIEWRSSNEAIAHVDTNGVVTGVSVGNAVIYATTIDGGYVDSCEVNVNPQDPLVNKSFVSQSAIVKQKVVLKGAASGGDGNYKYAYYFRKVGDTSWHVVGTEWGESKYATFKPGTATVYEVCIKVKDGNGNIVKKFLSFATNNEVTDFSCSACVEKSIGTISKQNRIFASSINSKGEVKYKYEYRKASSPDFITIKDFSTITSVAWIPPQTGIFTLRITAVDGENVAIKTINIKVKK